MDYLCKCSEGEKITLLSNRFTNKVLDVTRSHIVRKIVDKINNDGGKFGLCLDATTDISCVHQISVVVRYLNEKGHNKVVEDTIAIVECKDSTGKGTFDVIEKLFNEIGLDMKNIIGCSFDGALNMRSENVGVVHFLKIQNNDLIYTWCFAHRLNIAVSNSCKSSVRIKNLLQSAEETATFLRSSYKRMNIWTTVAQNVPGYKSKTRLKLIGQTRWSAKDHAVGNIVRTEYHLFAVIRCFAEVCNIDNLEQKALTAACNIFRTWTTYENILFTYLLHKVFSLLSPVTKALQNYGLNLIDAMALIKKLFANLCDIEQLFEKFVQEAHAMILKVNNLIEMDQYFQSTGTGKIKIPNQREKIKIVEVCTTDMQLFITGIKSLIQTLFLNEFDDEDRIYKEISFLDLKYLAKELEINATISLRTLSKLIYLEDDATLIKELKLFQIEFAMHQQEIHPIPFEEFPLFQENNEAVPNNIRSHQSEELAEQQYQTADFLPLIIESLDDLEDVPDIDNNSVITIGNACSCIDCILEYIESSANTMQRYKNIFKAYKLVAMLPSTQVKCERDFSRLKYIKNRLRNSLGQEKFQNLMIISLGNKWLNEINLEEIIDEIALTSKKGKQILS